MLIFSRVELLSGTRYIQAEAETRWSDTEGDKVAEPIPGWNPEKVLVVFGPEYAPLEQRMVENASEEACFLKPDILPFCAFRNDEEVAKDIDESPEHLIGFKMLKAQMNADLFTDTSAKNVAAMKVSGLWNSRM
jgi:adenine-specific DNA-methyltransferase